MKPHNCFKHILGQFFATIDLYWLLPLVRMENDIVLFLVSVAVLALYLIFSALTEMGTKLPWKK
jgi:hypothetical protein